MESSYPTTYNEKLGINTTSTFNASDFKSNYESATVADLKNYAKKTSQNLFSEHNYFNGISVTALNDVTDDQIEYLSSISENVQDAINDTREKMLETKLKTTNINYIPDEDLTQIDKIVQIEQLSVSNNLTSHNLASSNVANIPKINTQSILTNLISANKLSCDTILCRTINSIDCVSVYLYYNNFTIPLQKSQVLQNILPTTPTNPFSCSLTIKQNYAVIFLNSNNKRLSVTKNNSNDFLYNKIISLNEIPYLINIYYKDVLLK